MSMRHRRRQSGATSVLPEARQRRIAEHRRVRREVNQQLHLAALERDHDELVLPLPHPTHGYTDEHDQPVPHSVGRPRRRVRHWKQAFWKRRTIERRRRARAYELDLA